MKRWPWLGDVAAIERRRAHLWRLLGPHPAFAMPPTGTRISTRETAHAHVENWILAVNGEEPVPTLLLRPLNQAARGLVLYCHAHGNRFKVGKDELLLGRPALQNPPYGEVLTRLGFAVLAIDHWCFGERNFGGAKSERAMITRLLSEGKTFWATVFTTRSPRWHGRECSLFSRTFLSLRWACPWAAQWLSGPKRLIKPLMPASTSAASRNRGVSSNGTVDVLKPAV